jgi:phenylpyruvate tautomerase PptA (4-oxalocrotonate tautomerase family)
MPSVKISMMEIWNKKQKKQISDMIHESLVEAFKIPANDYNHRIIEFRKDDYLYSEYKSEKFILIEMIVLPGRSKQAKKELYRKITDKLGALGIAPIDINIVLNEPPLENWGLAGKPGDEADIGFKLDV